jgi:hypothetical protein
LHNPKRILIASKKNHLSSSSCKLEIACETPVIHRLLCQTRVLRDKTKLRHISTDACAMCNKWCALIKTCACNKSSMLFTPDRSHITSTKFDVCLCECNTYLCSQVDSRKYKPKCEAVTVFF